jgi:cell division protein FtsW
MHYFFHPKFLFPKILFAATLLLTCMGCLAIYAASAIKGVELHHNPYYFLQKQAIVAAFGFCVVICLQLIPLRWLRHLTLPLLLFSLSLLAAIFIPHAYQKVGGAYRWISLGPINLQPAELAKLAFIFFLARNLSRAGSERKHFTSIVVPNFAVLFLFIGLLMLQPDFGSSALLFLITFAMVYIAGAPLRFILYPMIPITLAGIAAIIHSPYRLQRLTSFLDPWANIQGGGFQIIQSYLGFRNGGLLGVGLGESRQKLFFLPEAHTDFIFAVIGEELGLLGVAFISSLLLFILFLGFFIALQQKESFFRFLCFGLTFVLSLQGILNLAVVLGLLPTKGLTLPFISSGASSLLVSLFMIGVISRLGQEVRLNPKQQTFG